jgi:hypothetical protein
MRSAVDVVFHTSSSPSPGAPWFKSIIEQRGAKNRFRLVSVLLNQYFYDYLIVHDRAGHSYLGHNDWEKNARGLKLVVLCVSMQMTCKFHFGKIPKMDHRKIVIYSLFNFSFANPDTLILNSPPSFTSTDQ